jgi:hypothetical protein
LKQTKIQEVSDLGKKTISDEKKAVVKALSDAGMPYRKIQEIIPVS